MEDTKTKTLFLHDQNAAASLEPHFLSPPTCSSELAVFLLFYPPIILYHILFTSNTKSLYPFGLTRGFWGVLYNDIDIKHARSALVFLSYQEAK